MKLPRLCWHKYALHQYQLKSHPWIAPMWVLESVCLRCGKKRR
jgi:hypothetical protein